MRWWPRRKVYLDNLPKTHDVRFAFFFIFGLVAAFGALYGVGYAVAGNTVPRGTTVSDVEIGSLSRGEAETTLRQELVPRLQRPLILDSRTDSFRVDPQNAGVTLDLERTVDEAMSGGDWDPRHMLQVIFGGDDIDPVVEIDEAEFDAAMKRVVRQVTVAPTSSKVIFSGGQPDVRYGTVGETVDLERLQENIAEALRDDERRVRLPMRPIQPKVTGDEADAFVKSVARPASAHPVRLSARRGTVTLPPAAFVSALRAVETADGLRLGIDAGAAFRLGASTRSQLPGQPVNARVVLGGNGPRVVQGSAGFRVTQAAWAAGVLEASLKRPGRRTATLKVVRADPAFTAADARAMQIRNRVATATIRFPASVNRGQVARAARQLDQAVLKPGAEWSFLRRVRVTGQPAATSLVASATYNAALLAGLDVTQRSAMSSPPHYLTRGREALALRPRDDLLLRNPSPYGVLLHAEVEPTRNGAQIRVEAWSTRYWKVTLRRSDRYQVTFAPPERRSGPQCQPRRGEPGYSLDLTRVRVRGDERRVDVQTSRYAPVRGVVCGRGLGR